MVMRSMRMPDGRLKVLVQGLSKARIESVIETTARASWVRVAPLEQEDEGGRRLDGRGRSPHASGSWACRRTPGLSRTCPPEVLSITANVQGPGRLADLVASNLRLETSKRLRKCSRSRTPWRGCAGSMGCSSESSKSLPIQADYPEPAGRTIWARDHREEFSSGAAPRDSE